MPTADVSALPGSDSRKVAIAEIIWQNTVVNMQWLADHRAMRTVVNVSQQIRCRRLRRWRLFQTPSKNG
jgi:hypothetical protein